MRVVARRVTEPQTVPWCRCKYERPMPYVVQNNHWVHYGCGKPSRRYWAVQQGKFIAGS